MLWMNIHNQAIDEYLMGLLHVFGPISIYEKNKTDGIGINYPILQKLLVRITREDVPIGIDLILITFKKLVPVGKHFGIVFIHVQFC